jgi:2',3'-cyclic-nucleotide 2'-phosphodiesterase (5'-nucleotidase family)
MIRNSSLLVLASLAAAPACARPRAVVPGGAPPVLRVMLVNDVYITDTLRDGTGGLARVATLRDSLARSAPTLLVLAGDVLAPSLLSKWYAGAQMVQAFDAARLDFATLGNHEFDISQQQLETRLVESRARWVDANCTRADGTPFPRVRGWDTVRTGGALVAFVGATIVNRYPRWVKCVDPAVAVRAAVDSAVRGGAEVVIGLTHLPVTEDSALLASEPRLTMILGGHEHSAQHVVLGNRFVRKADADARSAVIVSLYRRPDGWLARDTLVRITRELADHPVVAAVVRAWHDTLARRMGVTRVVATSPEPIDVRDDVGRSGESRFGSLVADAMRAGTGADVALVNGGAFRLDDVIPAGPVTNDELESIFLFPDETRALTYRVTGAKLREQLQHSVATQAGRGGWLQVSGIRFGFDRRLPPAERVVRDLRRDDGRAIADGDTLTLTFVRYASCNEGDGYTLAAEAAAACQVGDAAPRTVDLLLKYVAAMPGGRLVQPPLGRIAVTRP